MGPGQWYAQISGWSLGVVVSCANIVNEMNRRLKQAEQLEHGEGETPYYMLVDEALSKVWGRNVIMRIVVAWLPN